MIGFSGRKRGGRPGLGIAVASPLIRQGRRGKVCRVLPASGTLALAASDVDPASTVCGCMSHDADDLLAHLSRECVLVTQVRRSYGPSHEQCLCISEKVSEKKEPMH